MNERTKYRRHTFTIQNQGSYDTTQVAKLEFLEYVKGHFPKLQQYIIVQELNLNDKIQKDTIDTHLQGMLYFSSDISKFSLLKKLQKKYSKDNSIGRVHLERVEQKYACQSYFQMESKPGMDRFPLSNMLSVVDQKKDEQFNNEINRMFNYIKKIGTLSYEIKEHNKLEILESHSDSGTHLCPRSYYDEMKTIIF